MNQRCVERMNKYCCMQYKDFLMEKRVLDSHQFLNTSVQYLNYASYTEILYREIGQRVVMESEGNPCYNVASIYEWKCDAQTLLNKLAFEWISHVSNALDILLQYVNAALCLGIEVDSVGIKNISSKLDAYERVKLSIDVLWNDSYMNHIRSIYNYSKHTLVLYGPTSLKDYIDGKRDVHIPSFQFKGNQYTEKSVLDLMEHFEHLIERYLDVLDSIDEYLVNCNAKNNRYHIGSMIIDGRQLGNHREEDLVLNVAFEQDGKHVEKYWIERSMVDLDSEIEIFPPYNNRSSSYGSYPMEIEVFAEGKSMGVLRAKKRDKETSVAKYNKYIFVSNEQIKG